MGAKRILKAAVVGAVLLSLGCGEATLEEEQAERYAQQWSESLESQLQERAVASAESEAVEQYLSEAVAAESRQRVSVRTAQILQEVYEAREFGPALVGEAGLNERGEAVWSALQVVEDHHLDAESYRLDEIQGALETWEGMRDSYAAFDGLEAQEREREAARQWLLEQPQEGFEADEETWARLTDAILEDREGGQRLQEAVSDYEATVAEVAQAASEVEMLLARGLTQYGFEQRHFRIKEIFVHPRNWDYYSDADVEDSGRRPDGQWGRFRGGQVWREAANLAEDIAEEKEFDILDKRLMGMLQEVFESDDPKRRVEAIAPRQPQYQGLVEEYRRYREIVDNGGWEEVERNDSIGPGSTHPRVAELKERLRVEGYYPEEESISETWGEALTDAVTAYQETHQLRVTGRPHHVFWYSLNLPAERRLAQIGLNLDRWRETNVKHEEDRYAFVNIPDFTIEVWEEQERVMRFATVVGDNDKGINPLTDEEEYLNRTPTPMAAYIDRVAFNPYWNVTRRIRAQRILPDVRMSLEEKYALKLDAMAEAAEAGEDIDPSTINLGTIRQAVEQAAMEEFEEALREAEEDEGTPSLVDEEALAAATDMDLVMEEDLATGPDEEPAFDLDDPDALVQTRMAERLSRALSDWTYEEDVYNEDQERYVRKRFFEASRIDELASELGVESGEDSAIAERLWYLDWEELLVDVETTDGDRVPSWYEANGYEVVHPGNPNWEYVRMLPSDRNSLGMVKIIFPNYDNIYLHDTPEKSLFQSPVRGFSHGCIRLEQPYELSELLLDLDGQLGEVDIDQILADEEYHPVFLNRHVPIYLEYYTVRVDDEGRANFLADIYEYDDEEMEKRES